MVVSTGLKSEEWVKLPKKGGGLYRQRCVSPGLGKERQLSVKTEVGSEH